jgi:endoribonuclease Dicer
MSLATKEFLDHLQSIYPTNNLKSTSPVDLVIDNKWYIAVVVAFSASNSAEEVPLVFKHAFQTLVDAHEESGAGQEQIHQDQLMLARRFRDALFVAGVTSGYARVSGNIV